MKAPVIAHTRRVVPPSRSPGDRKLIRKVTAHVERHLGRVESVLHDLVSDVIHLDLLWVKARPRDAFHTFVTCGMSERPMPVTEFQCECRFAELLLRLPADWPLGNDDLKSDASFWPLRELEHLARTPHTFGTHIWGGHTIANGELDNDKLTPLCDATRFCGSVLAEPVWTPPRFRRLRVDRRREVRFFSVIPLYAEELLMARDYGTEKLFGHLEQAGVSDLVDPHRPDVVAKPS